MNRRNKILLEKVRRVSFGEEGLCVPVGISGVRIDFLTRSGSAFKMMADHLEPYWCDGPAAAKVWIEPADEAWEGDCEESEAEGGVVIRKSFVARRWEGRAVALVPSDRPESIDQFIRWYLENPSWN